jgi:hypothetical protein
MIPDGLKWVDVQSSNLLAVAHDGADLWVTFGAGGGPITVYAYRGVPGAVYHALLNAPSKGKFLNATVKGRYAYDGPL